MNQDSRQNQRMDATMLIEVTSSLRNNDQYLRQSQYLLRISTHEISKISIFTSPEKRRVYRKNF